MSSTLLARRTRMPVKALELVAGSGVSETMLRTPALVKPRVFGRAPATAASAILTTPPGRPRETTP